MKSKLKITIILLLMFIVTQFIGLYVVNYYSSTKIIEGAVTNISAPALPFGLETPEIKEEIDFYKFFPSIIIAFIIAISLLFLLSKFNAAFILKLWFFLVVVIALGISFNAILPAFKYTMIMALIIGFPLAFIKIYKRDFLVHNLTELFIYPGIAAVFVPILNIWTIIILLIIISIYDMWAVWHSGIMQKMAKYQINKLNIFSGFFVPYISKSAKLKLKKMRKLAKEKKSKLKSQNFIQKIKNLFSGKPPKKKKDMPKGKIKVNVAILGGGDVIFPIIAAGVVLKTKINVFGSQFIGGFIPALFVIAGATLGLTYLLLLSEKKKFYPAMPFITAGIFAGIILSYLVL